MEKAFKMVVNGYTIRWCPKMYEYHIRKDGKIVGRSHDKYQAIEACKLVKVG